MKIFVDSNIVRHSATAYRTMDITFGGGSPGMPLIRYGNVETIIKKESLDTDLRSEIKILEKLSLKIKEAGAILIMDRNTLSEVSESGKFRSEYFFSSKIVISEPPPEPYYPIFIQDRMNQGPTKNQFLNFLITIKHPRFLELAKYSGAIGAKRKRFRQLADAYWLWCAETNNANYFLTLDSKLINGLSTAKRLMYDPILIKPSRLLDVLKNS